MKKQKKQVVAIAIASLLGVCTIVNPITIVGQENNTSIQQRSLHTTIGTSILRNVPTTPYNVGDVAIDGTNFPDDTFRAYIEDNFDTDNNGALSVSEIASITEVEVSGHDNVYDLTGIEKFYNLTELKCFQADINSLNISSNTKLTYLDCGETGISSIDVSNNDRLEQLFCENTGIISLDVSNNKNLKKLWCHTTGITSLDVSNNKNLEILLCFNTGIANLNVSNNKKLESLLCYDTSITSLDVSSNTNLTTLDCENTPLAYLNLGENTELQALSIPTTTTTSLKVADDTFNIEDKIIGIDKSKITVKSGATYDSSTGIVSNYTIGTPIVYDYACGSANGSEKTITVTMNLTLKEDSSITITEKLDKIYDGVSVNNTPTIEKTGSTGSVTYTWEKKNGSQWESISVAPTDVGQYRVIVSVAEDDDYKSAKSEAVSFVIEPKNVETDNQIKIEEINADTNLDALLIKDGEKVLVQGADYEVTKKQDENKVNVTITFKGNYTGELTSTYVVEDKTPSENTDNNKPSDKDTNTDSVKTGDNTTTELWIMLMTIVAVIVILKKNKQVEIIKE